MTTPFNQLVSAIACAVVDAQHQVRQAHISELYHHFKHVYLFCWDEIPGNDSVRLINFLKQNYSIDWVKTGKIEKIDDGKIIRVSVEKNYLSLSLNNEKTKVDLKIDDGRTDEFIVKTENGKLNIYKDGYPVSVELQIPRVDRETGSQTFIPIRVPLIILTNPSQLSIKDLQITMQIDMSEITKAALMEDKSKKLKEKTSAQPYEWKPSEYQTMISTSTTKGKEPSGIGMAQVTLKVTAEEIPEGLAKLLDHLNKCL